MNFIERSQCLLDSGSRGNLNFTIIATYTDTISSVLITEALGFFQTRHEMLRWRVSWLKVEGQRKAA